MDNAGVAVPLPRWATISRRVFRFIVGVWSVSLVLGFIYRLIRSAMGHGPFFPTEDGWTTADLVFLLVIVLPAAISGLLWLAGEFIQGSREPL